MSHCYVCVKVGIRYDSNPKLSQLQLVQGDYEGLGETRKRELIKACNILGISEVTVIDRPELKDGPKEHWDLPLVVSIIKDFVQKNHIDEVIFLIHVDMVTDLVTYF